MEVRGRVLSKKLIGSAESVYQITQRVAFKMMQFYPGNLTGGIPGLFGDPYYWWEAGAAFGVCVSSCLGCG